MTKTIFFRSKNQYHLNLSFYQKPCHYREICHIIPAKAGIFLFPFLTQSFPYTHYNPYAK